MPSAYRVCDCHRAGISYRLVGYNVINWHDKFILLEPTQGYSGTMLVMVLAVTLTW
jgi:hypothetical protein